MPLVHDRTLDSAGVVVGVHRARLVGVRLLLAWYAHSITANVRERVCVCVRVSPHLLSVDFSCRYAEQLERLHQTLVALVPFSLTMRASRLTTSATSSTSRSPLTCVAHSPSTTTMMMMMLLLHARLSPSSFLDCHHSTMIMMTAMMTMMMTMMILENRKPSMA